MQRVIQMGEDPDSVFNTGALGIDNIVNMQLMTKAELRGVELRLRKKFLMVGFHTETVSGNTLQTCNDILTTLKKIEDTTIIFTRPNSDLHGSLIWSQFEKFSSEKAMFIFSKPRRSQISVLLAHCDMLLAILLVAYWRHHFWVLTRLISVIDSKAEREQRALSMSSDTKIFTIITI